MICHSCGSVIPYSGAFDYVICPKCRAMVYVRHATKHHDEAVPAFPSAAGLDRAQTGPARHEPPHPLPSAEEIRIVGPPTGFDGPIAPRLARFATANAAGMILFLIANHVAVLLIGAPTALAFATYSSDPVVQLFVAFPFPVLIGELSGQAAAAWHVMLIVGLVASCGLFLYQHGPGAVRKLRAMFLGAGSPRLDEPNGVFAMARIFCASVFVGQFTFMIANLAGLTPTVPDSVADGEPGALLVQLAHASVWEELVVRVLLLGLPLLVVEAVAGRGLPHAPWRYLLGGKIEVNGAAVGFLFFSATVFGLAHVPGWDLWKFPPAFVTGLLLGYLFLRYGLHAAIVMHFLTDYFLATLVLGVPGGYALLLGLMLIFMEAVGGVNVVRYYYVLREVWFNGGVPAYLGGPGAFPPDAPVPAVALTPPLEPAQAPAPTKPD